MSDTGLQVRDTPLGAEIRLHVQPRAKRCEIAGVFDGALKIKVTAPPVDDAANRAVIEFLSKLFGVSKSTLSIAAGAKTRDKVLRIRKLSREDIIARIRTAGV
jgi:uncharacterized protein (TIGR00251 family)